MTQATVKCPYCGAGWAGRTISQRHLKAYKRKNQADTNPVGVSDTNEFLNPGATAIEIPDYNMILGVQELWLFWYVTNLCPARRMLWAIPRIAALRANEAS